LRLQQLFEEQHVHDIASVVDDRELTDRATAHQPERVGGRDARGADDR